MTWPTRSDEHKNGDVLHLLNSWWRAANCLSLGQIYLLDDPLLRRPLERDDIEPRLPITSDVDRASINGTTIVGTTSESGTFASELTDE